MTSNNIEYCAVPISNSGGLMNPVENRDGPIKSSNIEDMLEVAAMNLPLCKGASSIGVFEYVGELRPFFASNTGQKYIFGRKPVASYPLN